MKHAFGITACLLACGVAAFSLGLMLHVEDRFKYCSTLDAGQKTASRYMTPDGIEERLDVPEPGSPAAVCQKEAATTRSDGVLVATTSSVILLVGMFVWRIRA